MVLLRPQHWPPSSRAASPGPSRALPSRGADGPEEADPYMLARPPSRADSPTRPPSRAGSPLRLFRSPSPVRARPASDAASRSKRPLSQHLYQKVADIARPSASGDAPAGLGLDDSYVHVDAPPVSSGLHEPRKQQEWPSNLNRDPFPSAPVTSDATLCTFFDVVLEPEDEMLNESARTAGAAVLLPELGMEEPYFKGLSSASPSVPIFNEDPGSTSLSVTALAFDDAKSNDYNYPKLENPLRELLETEREYVLRIRTIYNDYAKPLRAPGSNIISPEDADALFSNIGEIVAAHTTFLNELEALMKLDTPDVIESLGDVMQRLMACSTCYAEYLANAPNVTPTLRKVNKKSSFVAFTERVKSKNSAVGRIGLEELLIVPVQRMPRYQLLIEQILKYVPASSRPRARLQFVSQMARTIALRETDAETKQAAIRWTVNRHVHGLPPDLLSSNHPLMNFVDVDDFPLALEGPQGAEQETLAVTLLLFDDLMLIIQRSPGTSGTEALGLTNLNSLADLMQASAPGANASIAEQCISTPGLLQNVDAAQLVYKGHVGLMDLEARDLGGPDFQVRHTDKGVQSGATVLSARWSHRPVRQYAVVEPPPPATKLSGTAAPAKSPARVQKTNFLESLWRAQARKLSSSSQSVRRQVSPATFDPVTGAVIRPRQINYFLIHDRATWELDVRKTPVLLRVNIANTHSRLHLPDPSMPSSGPYAVVEITAIDQQCRCWVQTQFSFEPQVEDKLIPLGMLTDYLPSVIERLPPSFRTSFVTPRVRLDALDQLARLTPPPRTSPQTTRSPGSSPTGSSNSPGRLRDVGRHLLSAATGMGTLRRSAGPGSEPGANDFASLGNGRTRSRALSSTGGTASSGAFGSVSTSNWGSSTTASDHTHGTLATTMSAASSASSPSSHKRGQSKRAFHLLGRTRTGPRVESEEFPSPRVDPASLAPPKSFEKDVEERTQDSATPTPTPTPCPSYGKTTEPELKQASAPAESTTLAGQSMLSDGDAGHDESRQLPARSSTLLPRAQRLIEQQESQRPRPARSTRLRAHPPAPVPLGPLQVSNATNSTSKRVASDRINDNAKEDNLDERPTKRVSVHSSHSKRSDGGRSSFQSGRSNEASKASEGRPEQDRRVRRALYKASKRPRAFADMRNYLNDVRRHYGQEAPDAQFLCGVLSQLEDWFHDAEADSLADKEELETIVTSVQTPASSSARDTGRLEMENARLASELAELKNQCRDRLVELEDFSQRESSWEADRAYLHERLGEIENRNLHLQSQINDLTAELEVAHAATYGSEALQAQNAELITAVKRLKAANHDLKQRCEHAIRQAQAAAELDEDLAAVRARNVELQAQCRQLEHAQRDTLAANAEIHAAFNEELDNMWRDATIKTDNEQIQSLRLSLQDALAERNRLLADLQVLRNHPTELELGF